MTLVIFDGNTKNYTLLNKKDDKYKIELIEVQTNENNSEIPIAKQIKPKIPRKKKIKLTKENQEFLNSLTKDSNSNNGLPLRSNKSTSKNKIELTKENQNFLDALKT